MSDFFDGLDESLDEQAEAQEAAFSAGTWDPIPGETFRGVLTHVDVAKTQFGPAIVLNARNVGEDTLTSTDDDGIKPQDPASIWCSGTVLKNAVLDAMPALGALFAIRFEGKKPTRDGSNEYKAYTVRFEPGKMAVESWEALLAKKPLDRRSAQTPGEKIAPDETGGFF